MDDGSGQALSGRRSCFLGLSVDGDRRHVIGLKKVADFDSIRKFLFRRFGGYQVFQNLDKRGHNYESLVAIFAASCFAKISVLIRHYQSFVGNFTEYGCSMVVPFDRQSEKLFDRSSLSYHERELAMQP